MSANLTIRQTQMVLPDRVVVGDLIIENGIIVEISPHSNREVGEVIDGTGLTALPGLIDGQVYFSEHQGDDAETIKTGTRAAAAGGVTSILDMPGSPEHPQTLEDVRAKHDAALSNAHVHYGFYFSATPENIGQIGPHNGACGAVVHPTQSGMLENGEAALEAIFAQAQIPLHFIAEDPVRLRERRLLYPDTTDLRDHPKIHDPRTASDATATAVALSMTYGVPLHLMQVSSEEEIHLIKRHSSTELTATASLLYLLLNEEEAFSRLGNLAHTLPPIRSERHQHALWQGAIEGPITALTSGHRPSQLAAKAQNYPESHPGLPGVEWSLSLCLNLVHQGKLSLSDLVRLWCEGPAKLYKLPRKGKLEVGFDGDVVLVDRQAEHTVQARTTYTRCGWSPWSGRVLTGKPVLTAIAGQPVFRNGEILPEPVGKNLHCAI